MQADFDHRPDSLIEPMIEDTYVIRPSLVRDHLPTKVLLELVALDRFECGVDLALAWTDPHIGTYPV